MPTPVLTCLPGQWDGWVLAWPRSTAPSPGGAHERAGSPVPAGPLGHRDGVSRYTTPQNGDCGVWELGVTWVAGRAVDGFPGDTLDRPVSVNKEAVAQGVTEPLHGRGHGPSVGQGHAPGAAEEGALRGEQGVRKDLRLQSQGTQGTAQCPTLTARKWKQRCRLALIRRAAAT